MSATRYEILLPLRHNDVREVEAEKLLQTKNELAGKFGALTVDPHPVEGRWTQSGVVYEDMLLKFVIDVERDTDDIQQFCRTYKEQLKQRFAQLEIWIVAFPIRIV